MNRQAAVDLMMHQMCHVLSCQLKIALTLPRLCSNVADSGCFFFFFLSVENIRALRQAAMTTHTLADLHYVLAGGRQKVSVWQVARCWGCLIQLSRCGRFTKPTSVQSGTSCAVCFYRSVQFQRNYLCFSRFWPTQYVSDIIKRWVKTALCWI